MQPENNSQSFDKQATQDDNDEGMVKRGIIEPVEVPLPPNHINLTIQVEL